MTSPEFVLHVLVEQVELGLDGIGPGAPPHPLGEGDEVGGTVAVLDEAGVERGGDAEPAFHPPFQHGPLRGARIEHPAAEEPKVAVQKEAEAGTWRVTTPAPCPENRTP